MAYVAFFLLPLLVATPFRRFRPPRHARRAVAAGACALIVCGFVAVTMRTGERFPYLPNKITMFGFLSPNELVVGARDVLWTPEVGWFLSAALLIGALGFAICWSAGPGQPETPQTDPDVRRVAFRLASLLLTVQLLYLFLTIGVVFDRHLLLLLPTTLVVFAGSCEPGRGPRLAPLAACLLPLALYSAAATHDVHAFSRAAFHAGQALAARGIDPQLIEAGYAFDGWFMYERSWREMREEHAPRLRRTDERLPLRDAWYLEVIPRVLSKYLVSLSPTMQVEAWSRGVSPWARGYAFEPRIDGRRIIEEYPYLNFLPPGQKKVYVLVEATVEPHD